MELISNASIFSVGSTGPAFELPDANERTLSPSTLIGRPVLLFFLSDCSVPASRATAIAFRDAQDEFVALGVQVIGVSTASVASNRALAENEGISYPLLADVDGKLSAAVGNTSSGAESTGQRCMKSILIGPDWRVVRTYDSIDPPAHAREVLGDAQRLLFSEPPRAIHQHAPVLLIPNVLPSELCHQLIDIWEKNGNEESGFMKQVDGKTIAMTDYSHKIRRDHFLPKASPATAELKYYIGQRVLGDMRKAFNYQVTRFEDFRIACYDSSRGGYFRPHRDNTTSGTAHRRFAMSLLLNEEYEGGWLRFPEYGLNQYRPGAGGAVIFSCSLLHEAMDVTSGRRFVLLSFLFSEKEAKEREAYERSVGGTYRA